MQICGKNRSLLRCEQRPFRFPPTEGAMYLQRELPAEDSKDLQFLHPFVLWTSSLLIQFGTSRSFHALQCFKSCTISLGSELDRTEATRRAKRMSVPLASMCYCHITACNFTSLIVEKKTSYFSQTNSPPVTVSKRNISSKFKFAFSPNVS